MTDDAAATLLAALKLQIEWGADEALADLPLDRLASAPAASVTAAAAPSVAPRPPPAPAIGAAPVAVGTPAARAEAAALAAATPEALRAAMAAFDGCPLRDTASHLVFAAGDGSSGLMLIGEAPGADDDRGGQPFSGPPGAYLDRMLGSIGLGREGLLLAMLVPWRPPGGRPPTETEIGLCLPFLHRHIALARPRRLVLLGPLVSRALLGTAMARRRPSAGWVDVTVPGLSEPLPALPSANPSTLLTTASGRRRTWADLRLLRQAIDMDMAGT